MLKLFKIGTFVTLFTLIFSLSTVAFADEKTIIEEFEQDENFVNENIGVTDKPLEQDSSSMITPMGLSQPTTSHNLVSSGRMSFAGNAQVSPLYTNKYFTGKTMIKIYVKNYHATSSLKFKIYKSGKFLAVDSFTLQPGYSLTTFLQNVSTSDKFYIKFDAPSNFSGYAE